MPKTPLTEQEVIEAYFLEHRAKVLDIAAFLDRVDRSQNKSQEQDFRIEALKKCIFTCQEMSASTCHTRNGDCSWLLQHFRTRV